MTNALLQDDGDSEEYMCPDRSEPCFRSSQLLPDQSLAQVC